MHSFFAMTTLSPGTRVVSASRIVPITSAMRYESTVRTHFTPRPCSASGIVIGRGSLRAVLPVGGTGGLPGAAREEVAGSTRTGYLRVGHRVPATLRRA